MSAAHRVLVIEDHSPTAADLADIMRSMDCEPIITATREAALAALESHHPCLVLLDLSIPASPKHLRGRANVGISLLHDIRQRFGSPRMQAVWLPIIVVSGHANEPDQAVDLMKLEADDVIQKPYREADVIRRVGEALRKSGRGQHATCAKASKPSLGLVLDIPGRLVKRRTVVRLGGRDLQLADSELCVLMHLLVARANGQPVRIADLGNDAQVAYKRVDRLRKVLVGVVEDGTSIIVNHGGMYSLSDDIALGSIDTAWLASREHAEIARLSLTLSSTTGSVGRK
jgi:DNA-binding response OmpR family regulator